MPTVIDRAAKMLRAIDGVRFEATKNTIVVPAATDEGFVVRLRMEHDRRFVVEFDAWQHTFDRAEDAYDCFEYGLSDSCRLKVTYRGDAPIAWDAEKREYGLWVPGHHPLKRLSLTFWRPTRIVYRQNQLFRRR